MINGIIVRTSVQGATEMLQTLAKEMGAIGAWRKGGRGGLKKRGGWSVGGWGYCPSDEG